ncbi:MAG: oxidoreductase, partial [Mycobacterium sp.]
MASHSNDLASLLDQGPRRRAPDRRVEIGHWAGSIPQEMAQVPAVRLGKRWVSSLWLIPLGAAGLVVGIALAQQLRQYGWMQDFIAAYPGTSTRVTPVIATGFPSWLRWQHLFNIVFMMFLMRAGLQIL